MDRIKTYKEFYSFYLSEHKNKTSRQLHFIGTLLAFVLIFLALFFQKSYLWFLIPVMGYGFAWVGHYFFEKNKPATFKYPLWSLLSDFRLFFDILFGRLSFDSNKDKL